MVFFQEIYRKVVAMGGKRRTGYSTELPGANVYTVPCPIIHALNLIGGKWKLPVLWHLFDAESVRYNELKRSVVGITNIMLTQCLRELEAAGLVRRNDFGEVPPRVEYSLTGRGRELLPARPGPVKRAIRSEARRAGDELSSAWAPSPQYT